MEVRSETGHYHMYMGVAAPFNDGFHQSRAWGWLRRVVSAIEATPSCPGTLLLLLHRRRAAHSYLLFPEDAFSPQSVLDVAAGPLAFPRTHGRPLKVLPVPQPSSLHLHSSTHLVAHFLVAFNNVNKHQHLAPCVALSCPAFWHPSLRSKRRHSPTATQRSVSALFQPPLSLPRDRR